MIIWKPPETILNRTRTHQEGDKVPALKLAIQNSILLCVLRFNKISKTWKSCLKFKETILPGKCAPSPLVPPINLDEHNLTLNFGQNLLCSEIIHWSSMGCFTHSCLSGTDSLEPMLQQTVAWLPWKTASNLAWLVLNQVLILQFYFVLH